MGCLRNGMGGRSERGLAKDWKGEMKGEGIEEWGMGI
jgi:hypothetical protein